MANILLVEDNKNQCLLYEQELRHEGYDIVTANDGKEALEKIKGQQPDMIIMDICLPKMDGVEAMRHILSKSKSRDIPIIINTGYSNYKDNFMTWAADAYIVKSSDLTELKNKIEELLTNKYIDV
ncbi:MAG: response regulator [Candidatus Scalindua rubra]|uniref:Two component response regulator n=1 Tax=Candidatus Scalindua brodae TaxID=237368 RepID=A0A0B0EJV7_9BACT|nr:MAG: two component response regulator [Candidatus Scalindua brodae]MBZ0108573.1 response regulator [Candidatus Scalindua rubra]TWU38141.1 Response regulator ArlR [Candidatus Brocadiaceae bacterium S225]